MRLRALYKLLLVIFMVVMLQCDVALAKTWLVTSEVPTIPAAMDSASAGDTVLVEPGTYFIQRMQVKDGVVLTSIHGAGLTSMTPDPVFWPDTDCGLLCVSLSEYTEISGFHIFGYRAGLIDDTSASIYVSNCTNLTIKRNVIETSAWAVHISESGVSLVTLDNNTLYGEHVVFENLSMYISNLRNNILWGDVVIGDGEGTVSCNDFMNSGDIPLIGVDNFSADPQFCGELLSSGNFYLQSDSPCEVGNHPGSAECGLIGAFPVGCGVVPVEKRTWGSIKSKYSK